MSNMSDCRFENALSALEDCFEALREIKALDELSDSERAAAWRLLQLCHDVARYGVQARKPNKTPVAGIKPGPRDLRVDSH